MGIYKMNKKQFDQVCHSFLINPDLLKREPVIQQMISNGISRDQLTAYLSVAVQLMGAGE